MSRSIKGDPSIDNQVEAAVDWLHDRVTDEATQRNLSLEIWLKLHDLASAIIADDAKWIQTRTRQGHASIKRSPPKSKYPSFLEGAGHD